MVAAEVATAAVGGGDRGGHGSGGDAAGGDAEGGCDDRVGVSGGGEVEVEVEGRGGRRRSRSTCTEGGRRSRRRRSRSRSRRALEHRSGRKRFVPKWMLSTSESAGEQAPPRLFIPMAVVPTPYGSAQTHGDPALERDICIGPHGHPGITCACYIEKACEHTYKRLGRAR